MHFSISQRLRQQTGLSPQLQQAVKLLLLSNLELELELEKAAQENPIIQFEPSGSRAGNINIDDFEDTSSRPSLHAALTQQINLLQLNAKTKAAIYYLASCLDERGYLDGTLESITLEIAERFQEQYTLAELQDALSQLQKLDPIGVGARDLSECLSLQLAGELHSSHHLESDDREITVLAMQICKSHLSKIANRDYGKLRVLLGKSERYIELAVAKIKTLKHNPGSEFSDETNTHITPDILVKKRGSLWIAMRNEETVPKISLNQEYIEILHEYRDQQGIGAMRQKITEAKWLLKNIQQREETILRVACEIVARQQSFFSSGDIALRPLVLREIADNLELHESTVSRVTNHKYLSCPLGLFELKHFFSQSITTEQGDRISTTAVQEIIRRIVADESPMKPVSDHSIAKILEHQGYVIARRTVAKYRESLRIPAMHLRRH